MTLPAIIDAHCHLDFPEFDTDRQQLLQDARDAGVTDIVIPGTQRRHWQRIFQLCQSEAMCHACYGLHPYWSHAHSDEDITVLDQWLDQYEAVALGECGLDFRQRLAPDETARKKQLHQFEQQLALARKHALPVVIHAVHSTQAVIEMLQSYPGIGGMIHSYSGSLEQALILADMGLYISIGNLVTLPNAKKLRQLATQLDINTLLLETDAPDQPGAGRQGERNTPAHVADVLAEIAKLRNMPADELARCTSDNARKLFGLHG